MASAARGSVIIPARNEASSIARTLQSLARGLDPGSLDVIVACDGCTDGTADLVRSLGLDVRVIELAPGGKVAAINAAESVASAFPRVYLDADVEVPGDAVMRVVEELRSGAVAARPPVEFRTKGASWLVRRYYDARSRIPSIMADLSGAGVYGLSEAARRRFDRFPDVTADDLFAARIVSADEVTIVGCEPAVVTTPRTARALLRVLSRVYRGNREIRHRMSHLKPRPAWRVGHELLQQARRPSAWVSVCVYAAFSLLGRWKSMRSRIVWERDETSRSPDDLAKIGAFDRGSGERGT
jgi:glycosyltransferase involved in cell wall biosynthesis